MVTSYMFSSLTRCALKISRSYMDRGDGRETAYGRGTVVGEQMGEESGGWAKWKDGLDHPSSLNFSVQGRAPLLVFIYYIDNKKTNCIHMKISIQHCAHCYIRFVSLYLCVCVCVCVCFCLSLLLCVSIFVFVCFCVPVIVCMFLFVSVFVCMSWVYLCLCCVCVLWVVITL